MTLTVVANKPTTPWIPKLEALESNLLLLIGDFLLPHEFKNVTFVCRRLSTIFSRESKYWEFFAKRMNIRTPMIKDENGVEKANYEQATKKHYYFFVFNVHSVATHPDHTPLLEAIQEIVAYEMLHGKMAITLKYQRLLSVLQQDVNVYESYLCWVAREHLESEVRILLTTRRLGQTGRERALQSAIESDSPQTMKVLLGDGPVSDPVREACILAFASLNEIAMVELLIPKAPLSHQTVEKGVKIGAKSLEIKIVEAFMKAGHLSEMGAENALLACIKSKAIELKGDQASIDIARSILENGSISEEVIGKAVIEAIEHPHDRQAQILELLLSKAEISEDDLGEAVIRAAKYSQLGALHILLRNRFISHRDWERARRGAITNQRVEVVAFLDRRSN